jgi:hypothetical protein
MASNINVLGAGRRGVCRVGGRQEVISIEQFFAGECAEACHRATGASARLQDRTRGQRTPRINGVSKDARTLYRPE